MVGRIMVPKDAYVQNPTTFEYVVLHRRILNWEDYPGLSVRAYYNHKDPVE